MEKSLLLYTPLRIKGRARFLVARPAKFFCPILHKKCLQNRLFKYYTHKAQLQKKFQF